MNNHTSRYPTRLRTIASTLLALSISISVAGASMTDTTRARLRASTRVGPRVSAALEQSESVRVMILFRSAGTASGTRRANDRAAIAHTRSAVLGRLRSPQFHLRRQFESVGAIAGDVSAEGMQRLLDDPDVERIDLDEGGSGHLTEVLPLMSLDDLHSMGLTGSGVTVAVIDSGLDTDHADLSDSLIAEQCFCSGGGGCCPGGGTTQSGAGAAEDDNGHGTNVTGIVTSNGTVAPLGGAPDADIVAVKVLDSTNSFCCSSDVVAGLDWVLNNRPDVDIINMSLGTFALYAGDCDTTNASTIAFATVIDALTANGVTIFASSGNQASSTTMAAPACVANTISVGAVYDSDVGPVFFGCSDPTTQVDQVTCFTNVSTTLDIFAPGAFTVSTGIGGGTSSYAGTSQASPASAACAAALLQSEPTLTPDQIETALKTTSITVTDTSSGLSFPRVDCAQALASLSTAAGCPPAPAAGCRTAQKSLLLMKDSDDLKDKLIWKWIKGMSTSTEEFSDPTLAAAYSLCIYTGAGASLAAEAAVPPSASAWSVGSSGYKYLDSSASADGVQKVILKASSTDSAKVLVKGRGVNLPDPDLSAFSAPVVVQLHNSDSGLCWQADYDAGEIVKNEADNFKAKSSN